jgi:hypothetical protein
MIFILLFCLHFIFTFNHYHSIQHVTQRSHIIIKLHQQNSNVELSNSKVRNFIICHVPSQTEQLMDFLPVSQTNHTFLFYILRFKFLGFILKMKEQDNYFVQEFYEWAQNTTVL